MCHRRQRPQPVFQQSLVGYQTQGIHCAPRRRRGGCCARHYRQPTLVDSAVYEPQPQQPSGLTPHARTGRPEIRGMASLLAAGIYIGVEKIKDSREKKKEKKAVAEREERLRQRASERAARRKSEEARQEKETAGEGSAAPRRRGSLESLRSEDEGLPRYEDVLREDRENVAASATRSRN